MTFFLPLLPVRCANSLAASHHRRQLLAVTSSMMGNIFKSIFSLSDHFPSISCFTLPFVSHALRRHPLPSATPFSRLSVLLPVCIIPIRLSPVNIHLTQPNSSCRTSRMCEKYCDALIANFRDGMEIGGRVGGFVIVPLFRCTRCLTSRFVWAFFSQRTWYERKKSCFLRVWPW